MIQTLRLPGWHPTRANVLLRVHWAKRSRLLGQDQQTVGILGRQQGILKAEGKRRVSLIIQHARTAPDPDALLKSLFDALVKCGYLIDDKGQWCEIGSITFEKAKAKGMVITLEDLP